MKVYKSKVRHNSWSDFEKTVRQKCVYSYFHYRVLFTSSIILFIIVVSRAQKELRIRGDAHFETVTHARQFGTGHTRFEDMFWMLKNWFLSFVLRMDEDGKIEC